MRMMRAFFRCSACASSDMASCSASGTTMSRISTDMTVMPHSEVFASSTSVSSLSNWLRRMVISATLERPIASRSAVCAATLDPRPRL